MSGLTGIDVHTVVKAEPNPNLDEIHPGDTVKVHYRVIEGTRERIQVFQGTVIKVHSGAIDGNFTVRRVAHAVGVERTFLFNSPRLQRLEVVKPGSGQAGPPVLPAGPVGQGGPNQREALHLEARGPASESTSPLPCSGAAECSSAGIGYAIR